MRVNVCIVAIFVSLMTFSCSEWRSHFQEEQPLARVGDKTLSREDVEDVFFDDMSVEDSLLLLESYIDVWVKKQLKIAEAEQVFSSNQSDIDQKVEEYRASLLTYRIEQYYVENSIDTTFTEQEIGDYYDSRRSDFVLDRPMVRGLMVKLPSAFRQAPRLKELISSSNADAKQDFLDLCVKNELEYKDISLWVNFSDALAFLPTRRDYDYSYMMNDRKIYEFTDGANIYYAYISDVMPVGDYMPLDMVSEIIKRILFNRRKEATIRSYEQTLIEKGISEGNVEIFLN